MTESFNPAGLSHLLFGAPIQEVIRIFHEMLGRYIQLAVLGDTKKLEQSGISPLLCDILHINHVNLMAGKVIIISL